MALCPDFSDSDDGAMSDYCDYDDFKAHVRATNKQRIEVQYQTEEDKQQQKVNSLFTALSCQNVKAVLECFDNGVDVNIRGQDGWSPILLAASVGNPDLVTELMKRGADVNSERDGCTALMMACNCPKTTAPFEKSLEVIKQLVDKNANVKIVNRRRMTALMFAASNGNLQAVEYLLPLSDKNAEDNQKWTALFWAVNNNELAVVKYLMEQGFNSTSVDIRNNTPLDIAKNYEFQEIVDLFPKEEEDMLMSIIDSYTYNFEEIFAGLANGKKPRFFLDICNILCGVKAESVIKTISEADIDLYKFLSVTDEDLKKLDVNLPYQRNRILGGIYRFHKHPFNVKSIHAVPLKEVYSNTDMAVQILSTIKQMITMEASLTYIMRNYTDETVSKKDLPLMLKTIRIVQNKLEECRMVLNKLKRKTKKMDNQIKPADLITSKTKTYFFPWKKVMFSVSAISVIIAFKIMK